MFHILCFQSQLSMQSHTNFDKTSVTIVKNIFQHERKGQSI